LPLAGLKDCKPNGRKINCMTPITEAGKSRKPLKQAALALAKRGLAVIPLTPGKKFPPLIKNWQRLASRDPAQIEAWWNEWPDANIGVVTGKLSNIFALDIDMKNDKDGEASLRQIEQKHGQTLPQTVETVTPTGGRQLWYRLPTFKGAPAIKNSASPHNNLGDGLDTRGEGGYVVAPPSVVEHGTYCWSVDSAPGFVEAPVWFLQLLCPEPAELDQRRPVDHWRRIGKGVGEGSRNQSGASLAGHLLRKGVDPELVLDLLVAWDAQFCSPPQGQAVIAATVNSVFEKELKRRGAL
jgi:hypothetical protein